MTLTDPLPRILVIDDLLGRTLPDGRNQDRASFCGQLLLKDVTGDETGEGSACKVRSPIAEVVFHRGQKPRCSGLNDVVENDMEGVLEAVREGWEGRFCWSLVLLDLCFYTGKVTQDSTRSRGFGIPGGKPEDNNPNSYFGLQVLKKLCLDFPDLPVVILSGQPEEPVRLRYQELGALDFLARDAGSQEFRDCLWKNGLIPDETRTILGHSKPLLRVLRSARLCDHARGKAEAEGKLLHVLIRGETGTGKELLARYIHRLASRAGQRPFVIINTPGLIGETFYSRLFGHKRGSYTGADKDFDGRVIEAKDGDCFLDEIGDMPMDVQTAFLRAAQFGEIEPLGASENQIRRVRVRFLSATHADLEEKVASNAFREDLYYRLISGGLIVMPPLRDRPEDIPLLTEHFLSQLGKPKVPIEPATLKLLRDYDWPGNVRELEASIQRAVTNRPALKNLLPRDFSLSASGRRPPPEKGREPVIVLQPNVPASRRIDAVVAALKEFSFQGLEPEDLEGRLGDLEEAVALLLGRYIEAGLKKHRKIDDPGTPYYIERAFKSLGGPTEASQMYDYIKRVFRISGKAKAAMLASDALKWAYEKSVASRKSKAARACEAPEASTGD